MRGIFGEEFSVAPEELNWYQERPEERNIGDAFGYKPPPEVNVHRIPPENSIIEMLLAGDLDAACILIQGTTLLDRSRPDLQHSTGVRPLFPDPKAECLRFFRKTGLYPINHCVAVRRSILERHPWVALNLYHAFSRPRKLSSPTRATSSIPISVSGFCRRWDATHSMRIPSPMASSSTASPSLRWRDTVTIRTSPAGGSNWRRCTPPTP